MKKYKTSEAIAMLEKNPNLEFGSNDNHKMRINHDNGCLLVEYKGAPTEHNAGNLRITKSHNGYESDTWELIQQPIPFLEAVKAYSEGKTIRCKITDLEYTYVGWGKASKLNFLKGNHGIMCEEMLEGTWYVEDSNE